MNSSYKEYASKEYVDNSRIQADLNQNDSTAPDYVKGRTHWRSVQYQDPITFSGVFNIQESDTAAQKLGTNIVLQGGQLYKVVYDGTEYICKAVKADAQGSQLGAVLGNISLLDNVTSKPENYNHIPSSAKKDTGEPFAIDFSNYYSPGTHYYSKTEGEHTYLVSAIDVTVHRLDEEYLPESVTNPWQAIESGHFPAGKTITLDLGDEKYANYRELVFYIKLVPKSESSEIANAPVVKQYSGSTLFIEQYTPSELINKYPYMVVKFFKNTDKYGGIGYFGECYRSGGLYSPMYLRGSSYKAGYALTFQASNDDYAWNDAQYVFYGKS